MTQKQINLGNILIAEFMGESIKPESRLHDDFDIEIMFHPLMYIPAKYHFDYNWLIRACHKWDTLDFFDDQEYIDLSDKLDQIASWYEIEPLWEQLVENIKWYNIKTWRYFKR